MNEVYAGDPWDGRGLEWSISAPPPEYNFAVIPEIGGRDTFFDGKRAGAFYRTPLRYEDIELPRNTAADVVIGLAATAAAFGLVWHIGWLAILGLVTIWVAVIARSFARNVHRIIPAVEVEHIESRWLQAVADSVPIARQFETASANQGLAKMPS